MFGCFLDYFFSRPWRFIENYLLPGIPFDPVLYSSVDHFHKYGLRAYPAAEEPTKNNSKQNNEKHEYNHANNKEVKVLRGEINSENYKFPFQNIKKELTFLINLIII